MKREQEIDEYERLQQIVKGKNIFDAINNECLTVITAQNNKMFKASHELVAADTLKLVSNANIKVLHDYRQRPQITSFGALFRLSHECVLTL